jgi:putative transposase
MATPLLKNQVLHSVSAAAQLNNRADNSHQPTRQKERQMRHFKSPGHAQYFLSAHGPINNLFHCGRHKLSREEYLTACKQAFNMWHDVTDTRVAS